MKMGSSSLLCLLLCNCIYICQGYDLTVVGQVKFAASLSRIAFGVIECLKDDLSINVIATPGDYDLTDVPIEIQKILKNKDKRPGKVALFTDILWRLDGTPADFVPQSFIKIAYSMIEGTAIPPEWVTILNDRFDAVAVPDIFCKKVYKACGVRIPIFIVPCGMCSEELFEPPLKSHINTPFTFGVAAEFVDRKNYELLIHAFAQEFGNNPQVKLKIQGRGGNYYALIKHLIMRYNLKNVEIIDRALSRQGYVEFLLSLDCYVLLSKGEGFSLTPREALALGIPCVLSDNSAQRTICATGFVRAVPSTLQEQAYYPCFNACLGYYFNCKLEDARQALKDVYEHYGSHLKKAHGGRKWAQQFLYKNLKDQYLALVKPERVVLGTTNAIEGKILKTTSKKLYKKYMKLKKGNL